MIIAITILVLLLICLALLFILKVYRDAIYRLRDSNAKKQEFYNVLCAWIKSYESNIQISQYFIKHGYKKVLIYGMKEVGKFLYDDLKKNKEIIMIHAIDKSYMESCDSYSVSQPNETLPDADVLVVTAIHYFNEIEEDMKKKVSCPIISIEDVVYSLL